jgi:hypothetical protein
MATKEVVDIFMDITVISFTQKFIQNYLPRLTRYSDEIIGDHQCGFQSKRLTTNHIFFYPSDTRENV